MRTTETGHLSVRTAVLERHHFLMERTQVSCMGDVEAMMQQHARGVSSDTLLAWCAPKHAPERFDNAYYLWLVRRFQHIIVERLTALDTFTKSTPDQLYNSALVRIEWRRTAAVLTQIHVVRFATNHLCCCTRIDGCEVVIADGQHGANPMACAFTEKRYLAFDGVAFIPINCMEEPALPHRFCVECLPFMGQRTPRPDDQKKGSRVWEDPGRADAITFEMLASKETGQGAAGASTEACSPCETTTADSSDAAKLRKMAALMARVEKSNKDNNTTNGQVARRSSQEQMQKRADAAAFRDKVAAILKAKADSRISQTAAGYISGLGLCPEDHLNEEGMTASASVLGPNIYPVDKILSVEDSETGPMYVVLWRGYKHATKEPPSHLPYTLIEEFNQLQQLGKPFESFNFRIDQAFADDPALPKNVLTLSTLQTAEMLDSSGCLIKAHQIGQPGKGYANRMAGLLAWCSECCIPLYYMWMCNSETTSQVY